MNDNNYFVTFVYMVLFGNYWLLFWSFGIVPRGTLRPKQQPLISKQYHENACYAVIVLYYDYTLNHRRQLNAPYPGNFGHILTTKWVEI